jgi:hypothetical protein
MEISDEDFAAANARAEKARRSGYVVAARATTLDGVAWS